MKPIYMAIVLGLATLTTPTEAKAQYYYSGYYYYDSPAWSLATVKTYTTASDYNIYVKSWASTGTRSETFVDSWGYTWTVNTGTTHLKRGYDYVGSYYYDSAWRYQRLCGTIRYCPDTGMLIYTCRCGWSYYRYL